MWEQDPTEFLKQEGLLPLATLCRAESGEQLLQEIAAEIEQIKSRERRAEALNGARVLAGLRYNKNVVYRILKENNMLEESVVYQDILRKGRKQGQQSGLQQGLQQGEVEGERKITLRLLERRVGKLSRALQQKIGELAVEQVEALSEALLDFQSKEDLTRWLKQHA